MPHSFDAQALTQLLDDAEHLIVRACDHERRLADLVRRLEREGIDSAWASAGAHRPSNPRASKTARSGEPFSEPSDLALTVRNLCGAAREQRLIAETLLTRVLGELALHGEKTPLPTRVLVVDDSVDTCEMAAIVLEHAGFHVITAANGLEGVLAAHMASPAVVLMDINMPVLDGIEAARLLKASTATRDLQLIAYTAKPDFYDAPLRRLFVDVLPKPSNPDAIVASVRRLVVQGGDKWV